ncbi:MAG: site-specific integrase [Deltaproteobacteria bacterium]|nr:site-specific integrase [Deltaproteobacteria bacterium]
MSAFKKDGRWRFRKRVRLPDGTRDRIFGVPETYGLPNTKVGAEEAERRAIAELFGERPRALPAIASKVVTLSAFQPVYLEHSDIKNEYSSVKAKRQILRDHIVPAFGSTPLDQITFARIEDFKHMLVRPEDAPIPGKGLGNKTGNNILTVLRRLLALAVKREQILAVPEFEWLPTEPGDWRFLSFEDTEALIATADGEWATMIMVGARCGLRQGELLGLRWCDVDLKNGRLTVRRSIVRGRVKLPKNRRSREIPLGDDVRAQLSRHRHLRGELVFCDDEGNQLTNGECKHPLYRACAKAKIERLGWHVLRHTFGSQLASQGASMKAIQELMGHRTMQQTMRYAHLSPHVTRDAVKLLDRGAQPVPNSTRKSGTTQD